MMVYSPLAPRSRFFGLVLSLRFVLSFPELHFGLALVRSAEGAQERSVSTARSFFIGQPLIGSILHGRGGQCGGINSYISAVIPLSPVRATARDLHILAVWFALPRS